MSAKTQSTKSRPQREPNGVVKAADQSNFCSECLNCSSVISFCCFGLRFGVAVHRCTVRNRARGYAGKVGDLLRGSSVSFARSEEFHFVANDPLQLADVH